MSQVNEELLLASIVELQNTVRDLHAHINDMQMKIDQNSDESTFLYQQSFESNIWNVYHSFYGDVGVQVYVEEGMGNYRQVFPSLDINGSTVNINFDRSVKGYAIIISTDASYTPHNFNNLSQPYLSNVTLVPEVIEEPIELTNEVFKKELEISHQRNIASDRLVKMFAELANKYVNRPNFAGYSYKDEMVEEAVLRMVDYWESYDPKKSNNPFAYFTTLTNGAFLRVMNKKKKETFVATADFNLTSVSLVEEPVCEEAKIEYNDKKNPYEHAMGVLK